LFVGHTVINGDQIYPAVQPYANFGQSNRFSYMSHILLVIMIIGLLHPI